MAQDTSSEYAAADGETRLRVSHSRPQERYEAYLGDEFIGYVDYVDEVDQVVVTHTVIADRFTRRGYGRELVRHVLDDIATTGKVVVPVCPFVARFVDQNPSYAAMTVQITR